MSKNEMKKEELIEALAQGGMELSGEESVKELRELYDMMTADAPELPSPEPSVEQEEVADEPVAKKSATGGMGDCKLARALPTLSPKARRMYEILCKDEIVSGFFLQAPHGKKTQDYIQITLNACPILCPVGKTFSLPKRVRDTLLECMGYDQAAMDAKANLRMGTHAKANEAGYGQIF
jgi:hypothetical protein